MKERDDKEHDDDLALRLGALPREMVPPARVWAAVAEQAGREARGAPPGPRRHARARRYWPAVAGLATAASLALVLSSGILPTLQPAPSAPAGMADDGRPHNGVAQAERMADHYRQALAQVPVEDLPDDLQPALAELDRSAASIMEAIRESPSSGFLFDQLQRTYAQRLQLTQRAALGVAAMI